MIAAKLKRMDPTVEVTVSLELPLHLLQEWYDEGLLCTNLGTAFAEQIGIETSVYSLIDEMQ